MDTKWLGMALVVGALAMVVNALVAGADQQNPENLAPLIFSLGGFCGMLALIRLQVVGDNRLARAVVFLPLLAFGLMVITTVLVLVRVVAPQNALIFGVAGAAWLIIYVGLATVGLLTIFAKRWSGWRRFTPLAAILLGIAGGAMDRLTALSPFVILIVGISGFILLGLAIFTAETQSVTPVQAAPA